MGAVGVHSPFLETTPLSQCKSRQDHPTQHTTVQTAPEPEQFHDSPQTSSAGTQSNFGVPLSESDKASSTFADCARQAGIPDWNEQVAKGLRGNNSIFDGRWVLNPDEAWNVPARRTSLLTISPECQHSDRSTIPAANRVSENSANVESIGRNEQLSRETLRLAEDQVSQSHLEALKAEIESVQLNQARLLEKDRLGDKDLPDDLKGVVDSWQRSMKTE